MASEPIVAVATPAGRGGIGIVRISGNHLNSWLCSLVDRPVAPRQATHARFVDAEGEVIDEGILLYFPAPASFTGQDVIELQGHGSPVVMDMLVRRAIELGARPARPGEFSERAFFNAKLDLVQAEAVADLVAAESEAAARAALRSLQGEFSRRIDTIATELVDLRVLLEASLDFSDQDIEFATADQLHDRLIALSGAIVELTDQTRAGAQLQEGFHVVIAGRPNVGKSSILNALSGRDSAIVTAIPGTTRDIVREVAVVDGTVFHLSDTAGIRQSADPVEIEGMRRAREEYQRADLVLLVADSQARWQNDIEELVAGELAGHLEEGRLLVVLNKTDLSGMTAGFHDRIPPTIALSAITRAGVGTLREYLAGIAVTGSGSQAQFMARRRHLTALADTQTHVQRARDSIRGQPLELVAEELRQAHHALGTITGVFTSDDLLGEIFSGLCIGK